MADNITESGLNFEPRVDPRTTHDNWLQNKLHEMTMASESRIKFETMGAGNWTYFRKQLATMIQADMAADIGEGRPVSSLFPFLTLVGIAIYEDGFKPYFEKQKIKRMSQTMISPTMKRHLKDVRRDYALPPIKKDLDANK